MYFECDALQNKPFDGSSDNVKNLGIDYIPLFPMFSIGN